MIASAKNLQGFFVNYARNNATEYPAYSAVCHLLADRVDQHQLPITKEGIRGELQNLYHETKLQAFDLLRDSFLTGRDIFSNKGEIDFTFFVNDNFKRISDPLNASIVDDRSFVKKYAGKGNGAALAV